MFENVHRVKNKLTMDDELVSIHKIRVDIEKLMISTKI